MTRTRGVAAQAPRTPGAPGAPGAPGTGTGRSHLWALPVASPACRHLLFLNSRCLSFFFPSLPSSLPFFSVGAVSWLSLSRSSPWAPSSPSPSAEIRSASTTQRGSCTRGGCPALWLPPGAPLHHLALGASEAYTPGSQRTLTTKKKCDYHVQGTVRGNRPRRSVCLPKRPINLLAQLSPRGRLLIKHLLEG